MSAAPRISVLLPSHNYGRYIGATIESVLAQTCGDFELIISDDASTDDSRDIIRRYRDPRIRFVEQPHNLGNIEHFARMYALCRGEFIAYLDSDDLWAPTKLERQLAAFAAEPELALVATYITTVDPDGQPLPADDIVAAWFNKPIDLNDWNNWLHENRVCMSSILARKSAHDAVGVRRAGLTVVADLDLWLRFRAAGFRLGQVREPLTIYRVHGQGLWGTRAANALPQQVYTTQSVLLPALRAAGREDLLQACFTRFLDDDALHQFPAPKRAVLLAALAALAAPQPLFATLADLQTALAEASESPALTATIEALLAAHRSLRGWVEELSRAEQHARESAARLEQALQAEKARRDELLRWSDELTHAGAVARAQHEYAVSQLQVRQQEITTLQDRITSLGSALAAAQLQALELQQNVASQKQALREATERHEQELRATRATLAAAALAAAEELEQELRSTRATFEAAARTAAEEHARQLATTHAELERHRVRITELDRALDLEFIHRHAAERQLRGLLADRHDLEASSWFAPALRAAHAPGTPWTVSSEVHYQVEREFIEPGQSRAVFQGWAFGRGESEPAVRVRALVGGQFRTVLADSGPRPDVAAAFASEMGAGRAGFHLTLPLEPGDHLIFLETRRSDRWIPFHRVHLHAEERPPHSLPTQPRVAIVIPCFNYGQFVREAVDSALAQTWPHVEVVLVDDGSTDAATVTTLDRLVGPRVRLIRTPNRGLPAARNAGISATTASLICCLDADDRLAPTYVEKALLLLTLTGTDIAGSWQQNFGLDHALHKPGEFSVENLHWNNQLINASLFRRALWEEVGGYDETFTVGYEDWEFWTRCARAGARATAVAEPLFFYRKHGPSMLDRVRARHDEVVALLRAKNSGLPRTVRLTPVAVSTPDVAQQLLGPLCASDTLVLAAAPTGPENWLQRLLLPFRASPPAALTATSSGNQPHVVLALPWLVLGGVDTLLSQICRHLVARGIGLTIFTTERPLPEQGDTTALFTAFTPEVYHLPRLAPESHWPTVLRYFVQARGATHLWIAGSAFTYQQLPGLHDVFPRLRVFDLLFNTEGHTANNRRYAHHLDLTLCENGSIRDWLLEQGEWPDRIRVIPNGVDLTRFQPGDRAVARTRLPGVRSDAFVVGFLGRFSHEKAADVFLHLAHQFRADLDIQFVLAGAGPSETGLRELAAQLDLQQVLWPGVVDSAATLPAFDVLVVPSRLDGRPNVVLEAMACGVPVIGSRVGGLPELVADGETGLLVPPLDLPALGAALRRLRTDAAFHASCTRAARARAERELDVRTAFATYEQLFRGGAT